MLSRLERRVAAEFPSKVPCKLAFVGEAPSDEEVEKLRPFVGESGRLLNAWLRVANIERGECYVGNLYEHQLEDNDVNTEAGRRGRDAWLAYHNASLDRLWNELQEVKANVVVPLGGTALAAFTSNGTITGLRGNACYGQGRYVEQKLVPTLHPSAVLRQWALYPFCVGDVVRAAAEAEKGPKVLWPKRELILTPTIEEVEAFVPIAQECDLLSCDIETGWGMIRGISFAPSAELAIYVPFVWVSSTDRNYWKSVAEEKRAWRACRAMLESDVPKLGQNFSSYDIQWLYRRMGIRVRNARHDTRLLHAALYPELPRSLAFMGAAYSTQGAWKGWVSHSGTKQKDREGKGDE